MENAQEFYEKGWRLSVGIVLFNSNKDIFMGERIDNKGAWQMPQGGVKLNKNECLLSAAKRELFEETGIIVNPSSLQKLPLTFNFTDKFNREVEEHCYLYVCENKQSRLCHSFSSMGANKRSFPNQYSLLLYL